ncbi:MAG: acetyl-CoA carboxylase biotin carboxyl carrier protein [Alphaproteobacteria bacterium]|nr:acetyl-CoA carboxylase biotin carboxyl carrier protein [Alphaproteobacteria bacterium]
MKIDSNAIRELADLLDETGLTEVEVAEGDKVIRVSKGGATIVAGATAGISADVLMSSDPAAPQQASMDAPANVATSHPGAIKSPMVGTAYLQGEPGAPSFVQKGAHVNAGDTLLIIEAMKVMNPIKAEKAGTVTQILIQNGQPVEFGEVLMVIE